LSEKEKVLENEAKSWHITALVLRGMEHLNQHLKPWKLL
jgi:hypothetical protein